MSTAPTQETARDSQLGKPGQRIISTRLAFLFLASFGTLTSFYLLLSVTRPTGRQEWRWFGAAVASR